jgi:hypothetical protein
MESKLEPQTRLSPDEARVIFRDWLNLGSRLSLTTAFVALEVEGIVLVSRVEGHMVELCSSDKTLFFWFELSDRNLRLFAGKGRLIVDVAGDAPARLILTPLPES